MDDINKSIEMESIHILNLSTRIEWKCLIQIMNDHDEKLNCFHNSHFIYQPNKYDIHQ